MNIQEIKYNNLRWINIFNPTQEEIEFLRKNYNFHPLLLEECLIPTQRARVDEFGNYHFMVLHFPLYDRKTREIKSAEVDFFVGKDYLITIQENGFHPLQSFFHENENSQETKQKIFEGSPEKLIYHLLEKLLQYVYPMLDHVSVDITNLEKEIFSGHEKKVVKEILLIRRNITDFRRIMQVHKKTFQKLVNGFKSNSHTFQIKRNELYFEELIEHTKEIWDVLETHKESIEALQQTNESLISNHINEVMQVLTSISVTIFTLTLIIDIFTMEGSPIHNFPNAFLLTMLFDATALFALMLIFKKKKWI